jgi:hypothetical protein
LFFESKDLQKQELLVFASRWFWELKIRNIFVHLVEHISSDSPPCTPVFVFVFFFGKFLHHGEVKQATKLALKTLWTKWGPSLC